MSNSSLPSNRRIYRRYTIWFPVTLRPGTQGKAEVGAICRDVSPSGILVSASLPLDIGTRADAVFKISRESTRNRVLSAVVVRHRLNSDELLLAFPYLVALEFDSPLPDLLDELEQAVERTSKPEL
jgi:hypothetical protein